MKLCFPVEENQGMESLVYGHFGSAPCFIVVDTESKTMSEVVNRDLHHAHGSCSPLKALGGTEVDAIVVGGIGRGALMGLQRAGLTVYQNAGGSIADNLAALAERELNELNPDLVCGGHGHGGGCAH